MTLSSNIFNNVADISENILDVLHNNAKTPSRVNRDYDSPFNKKGAKIGDTYNVRLPMYAKYRTGNVASPSPYGDTFVPVTLLQGGADILLTSEQLTLNVDDFNRNVVKPLMAPVVNHLETILLAKALNFNQWAGTPGTAVTSLLPFLDAVATMQIQSATPMDDKISGMLNPRMQTTFVNGLTTLLNPTKEISDQYRNGSMGEAGGIDYYATANSPAFTTGKWGGTPVIASTPAATDGGNTVATSGWSSGATSLVVGDVLTISGVYAVNPVEQTLTADLKQFVVTQAVSDSSGALTLTLSPPFVITPQAGVPQNVNSLPQAGAAIYMYGTSASTAQASGTNLVCKQSLVYHEDALVLAIGDLVDTEGMGGAKSHRMKDDMTGMRCRCGFWYNGIDDEALFRIDILLGANSLRQGFGARILS